MRTALPGSLFDRLVILPPSHPGAVFTRPDHPAEVERPEPVSPDQLDLFGGVA